MSNVEEEKVIVTQDIGECNCGRNIQGRRPQYMPQYAPQQGARGQYGQQFSARQQSGGRMQYGQQSDGRAHAMQQTVTYGRKAAETCNQELTHEHNVDGKKLRAIIDKASFAMDDTRLFLDTHPDCREAMAYFRKMEKIRNEAIKEYEIHCGQILSYSADKQEDGDWNWNKGPLPWDESCCSGRRV